MRSLGVFIIVFFCWITASAQLPRKRLNFDNDWKFTLGDNSPAKDPVFDDSNWRLLTLPHDWSIEGSFDRNSPTTQAEGGLPAGIGWYRKTFELSSSNRDKQIFIDFDAIYHNSEVWINGHYLGKRPNGYVSFSYDLTPYLKFGHQKNVIAVRVDNSDQPNARWYTGSGIYRNVWLTVVNKTHFSQWGTFVTTPQITPHSATVHVSTKVANGINGMLLKAVIYDEKGDVVASGSMPVKDAADTLVKSEQNIVIKNPILWSPSHPYLYKVSLFLLHGNKVLDNYSVQAGIRSFNFDSKTGFSLNGVRMKIKGVCLHQNFGALGAVVNTSAIARQLKLLKDMGCNAIRTAHNPPAPEFLDLCDKMGFLVMDEAFDMWQKKKSKHDYHENWAQWHKRDLADQVLRDRNHPSVFMWSIGNEIREQFDSTGISIARQLVKIVKSIDDTRPVTSALSEADPNENFIYKSRALDVVGLNYHQDLYKDFLKNYPGQKFIATETTSALETRGFYDQPTDSTRYWPKSSKTPFTQGNDQFAVTSYDNVAAYWGSTHEETWKIIKKYDFLSGLFVWSGFDYLGEPTPYPWPARSSYFGIIDLAGFPKDVYYMYQGEWTNKPVLHLLPHWNWKPGQMVDVWAYYSQADEVELYSNGRSLGIKKKRGDDLHVSWKVKFEPGVLKIVSRKAGKVVLTEEEHTAGPPAKIILSADKKQVKADGKDLSFITVKIVDKNNITVPDAGNLVNFKISGPAHIAGVDNGSESSMEPFKANYRKSFYGLCLAIIQSKNKAGQVKITATSVGLKPATLDLKIIR
ncbi:MAG TPA: glycoside hydrolase family 2 TIM barrel-domain containing protein [Mucilaginibacter sp.]|nr:glycoside hydrolase family 2 TIM barrel-domain containing protein [Mucilaginibacter sp.]